MSNLHYKTKNNIPDHGMPRVYFCCHPNDFDCFFEDISNEIFAKQHCSIWYHGKDKMVYNNEFFEDLHQMHLFVIPVTNRFLQEGNPALEKEFRFAVEHNIPVLPLMQEKGLEKKFNELCGNIQYLDKYNTDSTCIEYADKLEKFLFSVLVNDEMATKIRAAFDAYIFLSYRKKDRQHAQKLMKLIHRNEFCRDIAIWYDEFLVPGENFNTAISTALQKCDLFVLTVTPNLVNESNYVMNIEFPMAKEQNKPILPCEMVNTDKLLLEEKFRSIPKCADGRNNADLSKSLSQHFLNIATKEIKSSPEHLFFIGMAYLHGIDVEVDRERAVKLITTAAEQELPDAITQLINMYTNGVGVKIDNNKAMAWRKRLLDVTKRLYEHNKTFTEGYEYIRACFEIASAYYSMHLYEESIEFSEKLKKICNDIRVDKDIDVDAFVAFILKRHIALANLLLGQDYHAISKLEKAKEYYDKSNDLFAELNKIIKDPYVLRDTSIVYNKIAKLCKVKAEYTEALHYHEKALKIQQENALMDGNEDYSIDQIVTRIDMSEIMRLLGDIENAKKYCLEALKILNEKDKIYGNDKYIVLKMNALVALVFVRRTEGDLAGALEVCNDLNKLEKRYIELYGEENKFYHLLRLAFSTQIYFQMCEHELSIRYGEEAIELLEHSDVLNCEYFATGGSLDSSTYMFVGMSYSFWKNDNDKAIKYLKIAADVAEEYIARGVLCNMPDLVMTYSTYADILQMRDEINEAEVYLKKAVNIYEKYCSCEKDFRNTAAAFAVYISLGRNYTLKNMNTEALQSFEKAYSLYNKAIELNPSYEALLIRDYAPLCYLLACSYIDNNDVLNAKEYYLKCVYTYESIPEDRYILNDWNLLGVAFYQLYLISRGFFKRKKWEKRLLDAAQKIKYYYPSQYKTGGFFELLNETGIFE